MPRLIRLRPRSLSYSSPSALSTEVYNPDPTGILYTLPTFTDSRYDPGGVALSFTEVSAANATELQAEIDAAAARVGHTRITLSAAFSGSVGGSIILKPHTGGSYWTYIVANALPSVEGVRANTANFDATITTTSVEPAIKSAPGADRYRLVGIEITGTPAGAGVDYNYGLVRLGDADNDTSLSDLPQYIILDRCWIHGGAIQVQHGLILNCRQAALVDSVITDIKWTGTETHATSCWSGAGPFKLVNNHLSAAGINFFVGGADPAIVDMIPSDWEVRRNLIDKDPTWLGNGYSLKNLFELKTGHRFFIEGNVLRYSRSEGQEGFAFIMQSLGGFGPGEQTMAWTKDVTIRYNWIDDVNVGISLGAHGFDGSGIAMSRVQAFHNLFTNIGHDSTNRGFQLLGALIDVTITHNTMVRNTTPGGEPVIADPTEAPTLASGITIKDNVMGSGDPFSMIFQSGGNTGTTAMNAFATLWTVTYNVTWQDAIGAGGYPATNQFPANLAAVGFVDEPNGDYHLSNGSTYENTASDGTDPGANIDALNAAIAGVE